MQIRDIEPGQRVVFTNKDSCFNEDIKIQYGNSGIVIRTDDVLVIVRTPKGDVALRPSDLVVETY